MIRLTVPAQARQTRRSALGFGAWFSNTLCRIERQGASLQAEITPVLGDLSRPQACAEHSKIVADWAARLDAQTLCVHDLHPDFYSTHSALQCAQHLGSPSLAVQHHHAHIAAVCAEHQLQGPVLGIALDGVGLGSDGRAWGGELLWVEGPAFERLAHNRPIALIGGDKAATEPWRVAVAMLDAAYGVQAQAQQQQRFGDEPALPVLRDMLANNVQCPLSSSMGRVFDGIAALLGLLRRMQHHAQAPQMLEHSAQAALDRLGGDALRAQWLALQSRLQAAPLWLTPPGQAHNLAQLDWSPFVRAWCAQDASAAGQAQQELWAAYFHVALIDAWSAAVVQHQRRYAPAALPVVLAGGCFFNRIVCAGLRQALQAHGYRVYAPERLLPGDSAIALGQAWLGLFVE